MMYWFKYLPVVCLLFGVSAFAASEKRPNIIVIMADDLGYADVGCYGCKDIPTPHIDSLATDGARFTDAYVTGSMCGPSRAGFLTGRNQATFGYYKNVSEPFDPTQGLPKMETIASLLKQQGYVTGGVGKWHMGTTHEQQPESMGFDYWYGFLGGGLMYFPLDHPSYKGKFMPIKRPANARVMQHTMPILEYGKPVEWEGYLTHRLTEKGVEFIQRNQQEPFFLFMSYNAPHEELEAPEESIAKFPKESMTKIPGVPPKSRSIYGAMVYEMDMGVGQILATLDALSLAENTIVWFLSDNGGLKRTSDNRPLRGAKGADYEGGLRVPMIVKWPGKVTPGTVLNQPVTSLDIGATSVAQAGGDLSTAGLHGVDVRDYITGKTSQAQHEALFWRSIHPTTPGFGALRVGDYKLMVRGDKVELYNLKEDLSETRDLANAQPERVQSLLAQWNKWDASNPKALWISPGKKEREKYQYADYEWLKGSQHYKSESK
ncbi:sulfatase-like hydrolase/transferase [Pontiellaceae bacterium B1224]|nr:sulfatase-like hydrolase/transferase [Pontiellaceae bacterium B1224]